MARTQQLTELLAPLIEQLGYEFVGLEYQPGKHALLRIYIDQSDGIGVDDCAAVSREVGAVLDVRDPISGEYTLEVSSPGLDRPLFTVEHFARFVGERAKLTTSAPIERRRKFDGPIVRVEQQMIVIDQDGTEVPIEHCNIVKARLVPTF